jgi:subtilisin family serine protease
MVAGAVKLVAPGARILPIRAFAQNGTGRLFNVIRAIHEAEIRGAKVVNLSLNTYTYSPELEKTVSEVSDRGIILVASTGNDGLLNPPSYPASLPKVTGVASINRNWTRSAFSNYGESLTWVSAPGEALLLPFPGKQYAGGWGTSFAAPMVSGLAAKLLQRNPSATYSDLQGALNYSTPLAGPGLGLGSVNIYRSIEGN